MRDYGTHSIPVVSTLPGSGTAGQLVYFSNWIFYWNVTLQAWQPIGEDYQSSLTTAYTSMATTATNVFQANVVANATYEVSWTLMWQTSLLTFNMRQAFTSPTGSTQAILSTVSGVQNGTTAPTVLELGTSGTLQTAPAANAAAVYTLNYGKGLVRTGTSAGTVALQACVSAVLGTLSIGIGSIFYCRRVF